LTPEAEQLSKLLERPTLTPEDRQYYRACLDYELGQTDQYPTRPPQSAPAIRPARTSNPASQPEPEPIDAEQPEQSDQEPTQPEPIKPPSEPAAELKSAPPAPDDFPEILDLVPRPVSDQRIELEPELLAPEHRPAKPIETEPERFPPTLQLFEPEAEPFLAPVPSPVSDLKSPAANTAEELLHGDKRGLALLSILRELSPDTGGLSVGRSPSGVMHEVKMTTGKQFRLATVERVLAAIRESRSAMEQRSNPAEPKDVGVPERRKPTPEQARVERELLQKYHDTHGIPPDDVNRKNLIAELKTSPTDFYAAQQRHRDSAPGLRDSAEN
jgi:hypothetical protein